MKKNTLMLMLLLFCYVTAYSTTFYVDNINGNDTNNDGLSWSTALKSLTGAIAKAKTAPYDVTVDDIFVKGGNYPTGSKISADLDNLYGGFEGIEINISQRPLEDKDGNGIIEPWEFKFPSKITSTFDATGSSAVAVSNTTNSYKNTFNGFTITQTGTVRPNDNTKTYQVIKMMSSNAILENVTIHNCNVQFPSIPTTSLNGVIIDVIAGAVKNCLVEKNTVYVGFASGATTTLGPIVQIQKGTIDGCVFRNNKVTFQAVGAASSALATYSVQGAVISIKTATTGTDVTMNNTLIYNNEALYDNNSANITGNQWAATAYNGALIKMGYVGTPPVASDSIVGCVIANNKLTNMGGSTLYANSSATKFTNVINNVLWNNKNELGDKNLQTLSTFATGLNIGWVINNAYTSGGPANTVNGWIGNNLIDLNALNADAKGPNFKAPTIFQGVNRTAGSADSIAIAHANWGLNLGSYLIAKGVALTTRTKDFLGNSFSTPRSIGAYDYNGPSGFSDIRLKSDIVNAGIQKISCNTEGTISVFNTIGKLIFKNKVQQGEEIKIQSGLYLIFIQTSTGNYSQKIIIK
jgi:hypothetical protein